MNKEPEWSGDVLLRGDRVLGWICYDSATKLAAGNILLQAQKEMQDLHTMSKAMVLAASEIVKMDQPTQGEQS